MKTTANATCPFCGCLCDDLSVTIEDNRIIAVDNGCALANAKFFDDKRLQHPVIRENNRLRESSYEEAIKISADLLKNADRPLFFGWSGTQVEAQCAGVNLCEVLGGVIDNTSSICHGPSILAIQEVGHPGCTLGQVKNRADLVIYWGCNPSESHPRHLSKYTTYASGFFVKNAHRERKLIVVDVRKTESADLADEFVQINPGGDYAVLSALRAIVRGRSDFIPETVSGVPKAQLIRIVDICKDAKFGAIFFGLGLTMSENKYKNVRNAIELTRELSRHTKFTITPMRGHWNVYGANEAFTWLTGYPYAVDFARGTAYYNPGETSAVDILARRECDVMFVIGSDPGAHLPRKCLEYMSKIPVILVDPHINCTSVFADVQIPVAIAGIETSGTAYRMDGVPLMTKKLIETDFPTDTEIINRIHEIVVG
ncbi:formylmethanofuran dehydrogenase subunit B [Methanolacinia petrolearia DSM 11571]|uniref:Formylmethanofuran dehydrogenase subunit B n=1 Tax=Methanolacinia petrolearia (strain DSM 11571 / OCM 486 / SEBR 4847) TaxID=679926 RepID=E1RH86_METP4|nr:formylmethanofuran dehydrogenase subunit B [Methanolacinia petrolearia]ADN36390.1 formylmethanofuran dehydrogenase subunit B [Methanolacinia petrolearia DSM 11571]